MGIPEDVARDVRWIADGVGLVEGKQQGAHSLLLQDGDVLLVDAGIPREVCERLAPHVDVLLLTHFHVHHTRNADLFRNVWAPREEARALQGEDEYMDVAGVARADRDLYRAWLEREGYRPCEVTKTYRPGGLLKFDRHEWDLVPAPGHSPGLTLLLDDERHILFSVDLDGDPHGPWYGDPACDLEELERTAEELEALELSILLTSHTPPRRRGIRQVFHDIGARIGERERRILAYMDKPRATDDIVRMGFIQGSAPSTPMERYFERVMVEKHLARLLERDYLAARQDGRYERLV